MNETYAFDAHVAARWPNQIQLVPDDADAFLAYLQRAELECDPFWHGEEMRVSVGSSRLIAQSEGAERVRYSVTRRGSRMFGVELEPIA